MALKWQSSQGIEPKTRENNGYKYKKVLILYSHVASMGNSRISGNNFINL